MKLINIGIIMKLTIKTSEKLKQELSDLFLTSKFNFNIVFPKNFKGSTILEVKYKEVMNDENSNKLENKTFCTLSYLCFQKSVEQTALDLYNDVNTLDKRQNQKAMKYTKPFLAGLMTFVNNHQLPY